MKRNLTSLYITLITAVVLVFNSLSSEAHFGSKGPFGGSVSCITVNDSTVYIGTFTGGVYESTNSSLIAWRPRPVGLKHGRINALAHSGSYLLAATDSGIFRFTGYIGNDRYWEKVNSGLPSTSVTSLVAIDSITFLAGFNGYGIYKTTDKGANWVPANTNVQNNLINGLARAGSRMVHVSYGGVWASDNNAQTWFDLSDVNTANIYTAAASYNNITNELMVFNQNGLYILSSASNTMAPSYTSATANLPAGTLVRSITNNGSTWFLATNVGIFTSTTGTINWLSENTGIPTLEVYAVAPFSFQNGVVAGTYQHGIYKTAASSISWSEMNNGFNNLETYSMIAKDTVLVVAATEKGVFVSTNLATSYSSANNGLTDSLHVNDLCFFGNTLVAATLNAGIFISADTGLTWTPFNTNLTTMNIRKVKSNAWYTYLIDAAGEIYQSDLVNGWALILSGLPAGTVPTSLAFTNNDILLGTYGSGIYIRPISGGLWTQSNAGLSNLNVTSVTINNQNKMFAGTDGNGVFVSDISTVSWTPASALVIPFTTTMELDGSKIQDMAYYAGYTFASFRGAVLATSDNGTTWIQAGTQFNLPSYADTRKLSFVTTRLFTTTPNNSLYSNGLSELPVISGVEDIDRDNSKIIIAPNPNHGKFNFYYNNPLEKVIEITVFDETGKTIEQLTDFSSDEISLNCSKGIYFLRITTADGVYNQKFIIQ